MDIERIALPNFGSRHLPSSGRRGSNSASLGIPSREVLSFNIIVGFFSAEPVQWLGASFRTPYESVFDTGCQLYGYYSDRDGIADASTMYGQWHHLGRFSVYSHQCRLCDGLGAGRRIHHFHHQRTCSHYPAHSDRRTGSDDINQFLCHVLYGKYFHLQSARCP